MSATDFYDDYVERQVAVGVNERHRAILGRLLRAGLKPHHRLLEIGCGVGTLTELLLTEIGQDGFLTATDLSPRSIEAAVQRLGDRPNLRFTAGDVLAIELEGQFDVVVLPDVIEHIPLEQHSALFSRVAGWLAPGGFVLLNYPNPHYLEWCREHTPEVLQIIDQPVQADVLLANAYPHGLYLDRLETYAIWIEEGDYVSAVLRQRSSATVFTPLAEPHRRAARMRALVRRLVG